MMSDVSKNSEILLLYEAILCNPNGDPDEENRPRIDIVTKKNLVTDVRLKRYFRDHIINKYGEKYIWITKIAGNNVDPETRLNELIGKEKDVDEVKFVTQRCIDARLFGARHAQKSKKRSKR